MFCYNCGSKLADDAIFCYQCGTKIICDEIEHKSENVPQTEFVMSSSNGTEDSEKSVELERGTYTDINSFKKFVDNYIQKTTEYQTAEELLNSRVSLWLVRLVPAILAVLIGVLSFFKWGGILETSVLALFFYAIFLSISYFMVWRKRNQYMTKFSGKFDGNITENEIITFLDENLAYLSPYFHKWGVLQQSGYSVRSIIETSIETALSSSAQEIRLCTEFGEKTNLMIILYLRPDILNRESGYKEYFVDVKQKVSLGIPQFSTYTCVYKTAPILQAAMEYYLHYYKSDYEQQTQNESVVVLGNRKEGTITSVQTMASTAQQQPNAQKEVSKKKNLFIIIGSAILALIAVFIIYNWEGEVDYESTVRGQQPFTVQDISSTYGEVFDKYILEAEWKIRESDDIAYVDISGEAKGTDNKLVVTIKVTPDSDNPDTASISPESITINDQTYPTQNDAVEFLYGMFWMYEEGYNNISELFSDMGDSFSDGQVQITAGIEVYDAILSQYAIALAEGWGASELESAGLNYLCSYYTDKSEIGYTYLDIDHNGITELLIGDTSEYGGVEGWFFDLYTIVDGSPVLIISSGERDRYYLCVDGFISNAGSSSAFESSNSYYWIQPNGTLGLSEAVIYNGINESEESWFYSTVSSYYDSENCSPISEEVAQQIMQKHALAQIEFIPFDGDSEPLYENEASYSMQESIPNVLLFSNQDFIGLLGKNKEELIQIFGMPEGGTPVTGELLYGGTEFYVYDGIGFMFDEQGNAIQIQASAELIEINSQTLRQDRSGILELLGNPNYEEQLPEDESGEGFGGYYVMEYSVYEGGLITTITIQMPNADSVATTVQLNQYME